MKDITGKNFGVVIAFLLPGFLLLYGISLSFEDVATWLVTTEASDNTVTVGGFLYASLASLSLGLMISAVRWLIVDHALRLTGIRDPGIKFENLKDKDKYAAFIGAVENHYRYYQYYSNTLVAVIFAFVIYLLEGPRTPSLISWIGIIFISVTLFLGARDSLKKYYERSNAVLK
jgi:hypothetical protein